MSVMRTFRLGSFLNVFESKKFFVFDVTNLQGCISYVRNFTSTSSEIQTSEKMHDILQKRFPKAKKIEVNDLSGGCGSMYEIFVETVEFKGLPLVKQHRLINETLKDQIKNMHGLTVRTEIPDSDES